MVVKALKFVAVLIGLAVAAVAIYIALNFTYIKRTVTGSDVEQVREVDWYEPLAPLAFNEGAEPLDRSDEIHAQSTRFADAIAYAEEVNSSAFLVYQGGELVVEKYWAPYDRTSNTQTNSVHKSLLSLAVGIAIEAGDIGSVSDPVSDYLGSWIDLSLGDIRVEHLLNMSSGLGDEPAKFFLFSHFLKLLNSPDISQVAQSLPQKNPPGQEFEYINNNPQLLVDVLEAATGMAYEDYLDEKIWSKMAANPGYLWMDREGGAPHGYCCLIALPEDLLRLGLLVLNQGELNGEQIVPKAWIEQAVTPSELNPNYGYLMWLGSPHTAFRKYSASAEFGVAHSEPYLADDLIYFDGFGGQRVYIVPSRDLVVVRVGETRFDFDDALLPNKVMAALDEPSAEPVYSDLELEVEYRPEKPLNIRLFYPKSSAEQHSLIVFSHGHYLNNTGYQALIEQWVQRGYVVAAPLHLDTGTFEEVGAINEKYGGDWVASVRPMDMSAILDHMEDLLVQLDDFDGSVDVDRVIAAGHSFGALSAQWAAGATYETHAWSLYPLPESLVDSRFVAVVAISPPGLAPDHFSEKTWQSLSIPQLVTTGTEDSFERVWTDYREHLVSYNEALPGNNHKLVFEGVDHYFGNLIGRPELEGPPQEEALDSLVEVSDIFMRTYLPSDAFGEEGSDGDPLDASIILSLPKVIEYEHR